MRKVDFPAIDVPARPELTTYHIGDTLRQYMEAGEYRLWELKLLALVGGSAGGATQEAVSEAAARLAQYDQRAVRAITDTTRDLAPFLFWRRAREIYDVHPSMTRALIAMGSKAVIPGSVFRRLRHPNPLFITTAGTEVLHADGQPGRIVGFYVTGAISNEYPAVAGHTNQLVDRSGRDTSRRAAILRSTHDEGANALHVVVASEVLSKDRTRMLDMDMCHITIPMTADFTLDGLVEEVSDGGFRWAQSMRGPVQSGNVDGYLRTMARIVVSHLLYACSRTSEIAEGKNDRPPVRRERGKPKPPQPAKVHRVGYRTGAKIEDNVRWVREQRTPAGTGRTLPPHIRAAHPHLYRVGPGRKEIEIKFLDPILVNVKDDDGVTATVHPMGGSS